MTSTSTPPRQPFETVDVPDVEPLDYVSFHAIVEPREDVFVKAKTAKGKSGNRNVKLVRPVSGAGQVRRIAVTNSRCVPPRFAEALERDGDLTTMSFRTARVDTGPAMGVVTAILNGATCTGKQLRTDDAGARMLTAQRLRERAMDVRRSTEHPPVRDLGDLQCWGSATPMSAPPTPGRWTTSPTNLSERR